MSKPFDNFVEWIDACLDKQEFSDVDFVCDWYSVLNARISVWDFPKSVCGISPNLCVGFPQICVWDFPKTCLVWNSWSISFLPLLLFLILVLHLNFLYISIAWTSLSPPLPSSLRLCDLLPLNCFLISVVLS